MTNNETLKHCVQAIANVNNRLKAIQAKPVAGPAVGEELNEARCHLFDASDALENIILAGAASVWSMEEE